VEEELTLIACNVIQVWRYRTVSILINKMPESRNPIIVGMLRPVVGFAMSQAVSHWPLSGPGQSTWDLW